MVAAAGRMSVERWRDEAEREAGASREHETARCAVHESPRARDAKAPGPVVETRKRFALFSTCHEVEDSRKSADFERIDRKWKRIPH